MALVAWPHEQPTIVGDDLQLRPWHAADADQVFAACQDPDIQRWTTVPVPYHRAHAVDFVERMAPEAWATRSGALFGIVGPTGRVLGSCGLVAVEAEHHVAEVGYWVAREARGIGIAQRALRALIGWALDEGHMRRLEFHIDPANSTSCRVAERVGGIREGLMRSKVRSRGARPDLLLYAVVA